MTDLPAVSLIVLNYNGRHHLETCLPSLRALDYPRELLEIIVCDNGSHDGSAAYVADHFPQMRVVRLDQNYGFAEGNNRAARQARHPWIAFLNNDMWVERSWLRDLVAPLASQPRLTSISSRILNWDGTAIDFIGSGMNFEGHGFQIDIGRPRSSKDVPRRLLSPCGGAMLIRADAFREVGGFDQEYFGLFEDEDLGWRLNLMGHDHWYAAGATAYHRLHGTIKRFQPYRIRVLYERNALMTIYKCLETANLNAVWPAALLLVNERGLGLMGIGHRRFQIRPSEPPLKWTGPATGPAPVGEPAGPATPSMRQKVRRVLQQEGSGALLRKGARYMEQRAGVITTEMRRRFFPGSLLIPPVSISPYVALTEFGHALEALKVKREWLQARRVRSDAELLPLFVDALRPSWNDPTYTRFYRQLVSVLGIDQRFALQR